MYILQMNKFKFTNITFKCLFTLMLNLIHKILENNFLCLLLENQTY